MREKHVSHSSRYSARVVHGVIVAGLLALSYVPAAVAQCDSDQQPQLITFSEHPAGTGITTQYQALGAVFAGGAFITEDAASPTSPVLSGTPLFRGPITVTFVNPDDPGAAALATGVGVDAGYFDDLNSVAITYFDINGNTLGSIANTRLGIEHFTIPGSIHGFTIAAIGDEPAGFAIDNLSFEISPGLTIKAPKADDQFAVTQNDYRETAPITFEADDPSNAGKVNWSVQLEYATSGGRGAFTAPDSFNSHLNQATTRTYKSEGGRLTINASEPASSGDSTACPVKYAYVIGTPIPNAAITARLDHLYHGATPGLLTGIATKESTYTQFAEQTLFGVTARWPTESFDGGSHIGLMQVPTTKDHAWDWYLNTRDGAMLFAAKIRTARRLERRIRKQHRGLPRLTKVQLENMALVLYGPYARADLTKQYYAVQVVNNTPQWVVNTAGNANGVDYADSVRSLVK